MELLLDHLRNRLFSDGENTERIFIDNDTLYEHPILNIKYTSYEVLQEKDIVHVGYGRTGVMVYAPGQNENEPWSYANILAVYHIIVRTASNPKPQTLTVLWVRWMERSTTCLAGMNSKNYARVSYVPWSGTRGDAFDFVNPSHIVRACHLVPAFNLGRTHALLDPSIARDPEGDWCAFYANWYDRNLSKLPFTNLICNMMHGPCNTGLSIGTPSQGLPVLALDAGNFKLPKFSILKLAPTTWKILQAHNTLVGRIRTSQKLMKKVAGT